MRWGIVQTAACLTLLLGVRVCKGTTNTVKFWCLRGENTWVDMQMEISNSNTQTPISKISAVDQDTGLAIDGCSSDNVISGTGTTADPMKLTVVVTDLDSGTTNLACGHKISGDKVYTWVFRVTTTSPVTIPSLKFGSDGDETLTCEFDPVINPVVVNMPDVDNSPAAIERKTVTPFVEEIQLMIAHPTTYTKILVAPFASEAIIHLQLLPTTTGSAMALTGVNCMACPTSACDVDTVLLIGANGCEVSSEGIFEASAYAGFYSKRDPSNNIGAETVYSNIFKMFRFSQGDFVYFKCSVLYCYDYDAASGNPYCDDHCESNGRRKRKRRSQGKRREQSTMAVIRVLQGASTGNDTSSGTAKETSCVTRTGLLVAIPSLAVLSVLATVSAFISCAVLHNGIVKSRQKQDPK